MARGTGFDGVCGCHSTAETFKDGWVYTGDEGYVNEKKELFIIDRIKVCISCHCLSLGIEAHATSTGTDQSARVPRFVACTALLSLSILLTLLRHLLSCARGA